MDKKRQCPETRGNTSSLGNGLPKKVSLGHQSSSNSSQQAKYCGEPSIEVYDGMGIEPSENPSSMLLNRNQMNQATDGIRSQDFDPSAMLSNLSIFDQKIHQIQDLLNLIVDRRAHVSTLSNELLSQQQHIITTDLMSIITQLISTAGSLLPSMNNTLFTNHSSSVKLNLHSDYQNPIDLIQSCKAQQHSHIELEMKEEDDPDDGDNLPCGSYEILQLEREEILAPHTHFCTICGKGFKRDANLRMHMRGHGDEYKTPEALAKPHKELSSEPMPVKRYSCPFAGCKRNKNHKKFQPLKTILCVKNHYKRTHCDKSYTCCRCNKKRFSVIADLKTHEKHCGKDKWLCSCGTTFSRKDKLFGHITLFKGHTPVIPLEPCLLVEKGGKCEATSELGFGLDFSSSFTGENLLQNLTSVGGNMNDTPDCFSPMNFDTYSLNGFNEFSQALFDDPESSFSFLHSGSCNLPPQKEKSDLNNLDEQL